jgi:hypothetical protein
MASSLQVLVDCPAMILNYHSLISHLTPNAPSPFLIYIKVGSMRARKSATETTQTRGDSEKSQA